MEPREFIEASPSTVVTDASAAGVLRGTDVKAEVDWWLVGTYREGRLLEIKSPAVPRRPGEN